MTDLKPCPFCGGDTDLDYWHNENDDGGGTGRVTCVDCGIFSSGSDYGWMTDEANKRKSKSEAIAAWNRRAIPAVQPTVSPDVVALVEALEYYADQYCEGFCQDLPSAGYTDEKCELDCGGCKARAALARVKGVM